MQKLDYLQKIQLHVLANILFLNVTGEKGFFPDLHKRILWKIANFLGYFLDINNVIQRMYQLGLKK